METKSTFWFSHPKTMTTTFSRNLYPFAHSRCCKTLFFFKDSWYGALVHLWYETAICKEWSEWLFIFNKNVDMSLGQESLVFPKGQSSSNHQFALPMSVSWECFCFSFSTLLGEMNIFYKGLTSPPPSFKGPKPKAPLKVPLSPPVSHLALRRGFDGWHWQIFVPWFLSTFFVGRPFTAPHLRYRSHRESMYLWHIYLHLP